MKRICKFFLLAISVLNFNCSTDKLEIKPETSFDDQSVLETIDNVKTALMGAYAETGNWQYFTISEISMDVMGNDAFVSDGSYGFSTYDFLTHSYNFDQHSREITNWHSAYSPYMWKYAYEAIDQCNAIINGGDELPAGSEDYLGQAYGLRAYNFLKLYHLFSPSYSNAGPGGQGLFLRLQPGSIDKDEDVPRSDLETSLHQILSDLDNAYENITTEDVYFINKEMIAVMYARVYLELGEYDAAQEWIETVSNFDGSDLMSKEEYQAGFNTPNVEWIWAYRFTSETSNIFASIPSFYWLSESKDRDAVFGTPEYGSQTTRDYLNNNKGDTGYLEGYSTIRFPLSFVNMFEPDDYRALFPYYLSKNDGYFTAKFSSKESLGVADYPMARIAEAYLIEAEALLNSNPVRGLEVLNALQARRNGKISNELTIDEIWNERRRELYGEGFSLGDIKRYQKPLERVGDEQWSQYKNLPANSPMLMFPIPDKELDFNSATTDEDQNEYWR